MTGNEDWNKLMDIYIYSTQITKHSATYEEGFLQERYKLNVIIMVSLIYSKRHLRILFAVIFMAFSKSD